MSLSFCKHGKPRDTCPQCNRRLVGDITSYLEPKQIFKLITEEAWPYAWDREMYECRDRAFMSCALASAGRVTPVCGGPRLLVVNTCLDCGEVIRKKRVGDGFRWVCDGCGKNFGRVKPDKTEINVKLEVVGEYTGLTRENLQILDDSIQVSDMKVAKRTMKLIEKRGVQVTLRDPFRLPLEKGLYESEFGDQLVPFGWLLLEYLERFKPEGRLFPFKRCRGWGIIKTVTGKFPNWFRAQAEHFYGHYIIHDSVRLSKFVKVERAEELGHYIGFSYDSLLKDKQRYMDFKWIDKAVNQIKERMK